MKLISVNALENGEKLYSNITNCRGLMMLKNGTILTDDFIDKLKKVGISAVYVDDEYSEDMEIRPALSSKTKVQILDKLSSMQKSILHGDGTVFSNTRKMSHEILDEVRAVTSKPINLVNTYAVDRPVLFHSINVAIIVAAMAVKENIRPELAENYVTAALFHDILLSDMANDNDATHAEKIYIRMKDSALVSTTTYMSVAMHHEKFDGTGAIKGYAGAKISEGARLIAVADMYDNLVFGHSGYKRLTTYAAVEYMIAESGKALDPALVDMFSKCVAVYPTGSTVLLNNGFRAVVINQNEGLPTRPVVRVINKEDNKIINLLWEHTIFINELYL